MCTFDVECAEEVQANADIVITGTITTYGFLCNALIRDSC